MLLDMAALYQYIARSPRSVRWLMWNFSGLRYLWLKLFPAVGTVFAPGTVSRHCQPSAGAESFRIADARAEPASTFTLWLVAFYIAMFGVASQRYENRVDLIENKINALYTQVAAANGTNAFWRLDDIQRMPCPVKPELEAPATVLWSLFAPDGLYQEGVEDLKALVVANKDRLVNVDLRNATLSQIDLHRGQLAHANLSGVNFTESSLAWINMQNSTLALASFRNATLFQANLENARMIYTDLQHEFLLETDLRRTMLYFADFRDAQIQNSDLRNASLLGANCSGAKFIKTKLDGATIGSQQVNNKWIMTEFKNSKFEEAIFEDPLFRNAVKLHVDFTKFRGVYKIGSDSPSAAAALQALIDETNRQRAAGAVPKATPEQAATAAQPVSIP